MERWQTCSRTFAKLLASVFASLQRSQPDPSEHDIVWHGPHWLRPSRRQRWCPTRFTLFDGRLFASVRVGTSIQELTWRIGTRDVQFAGIDTWTLARSDESLWTTVLRQLRERIARALRDPERFHRFVSRVLPPDCRTGWIQRRWQWPRDVHTAMPARTIARAARALASARARPRWPTMTLQRLLDCEVAAYDAAFPALRRLAAPAKRKRLADTRHGGLLDLPRDDASAFARWYRDGREWGAHPHEIVFANPHGITLAPIDHAWDATGTRQQGVGWQLLLSVDNLGLYTHTLRMAIALDAQAVPFDLVRADQVFAAVRGEDEIEVGPELYSVRHQELVATRPEAARHIRWAPVPRIEPITAEQRARLDHVLRTGRPPLDDT